jgi:deoxyribodipyrimidine photo-lyase
MKVIGMMHNRLRMIVASYLTKDLLIDWKMGEKHFAHYLVDYDPAQNNGGWVIII